MKKLIRNLVNDFVHCPLESFMNLSLALFSFAAAVCIIIMIIRMIAGL